VRERLRVRISLFTKHISRATGKVIGELENLFLEFKKMFCCFFKFFRFLICRVFFFAECFLTLGKVSEKKYSAKNPLPIKYLPSVLCRVLHLAKALPSVK
jgi:hypothetical protein